jgi:hypothetical protein
MNNEIAQMTIHKILTILIALVWLANGLLCKVLGLVARHEQIVAHILGNAYAHELTVAIGVSEIVMALWIISGFKARFNAFTQIAVIITMNTMEFILVPDLLLWGKWNAFFALLFIGVIYLNECYLNKKQLHHQS